MYYNGLSMSRSHRLKRKTNKQVGSQLEKLVLLVAIVEPLMTLPQIIQIYVSHNTGSSMATWVMYLVSSAIWLVFGIKTHNIPIIVTDILWVMVEALVVVGLLVVH